VMLQRVGVAGDQLLYAAREVKGEGDGHDDEQHAAEGSKATSALRETAVPLDEPVAGQGDAQQRHGGARGEEEAEQHAVEAGVVSCTQRRYRASTGPAQGTKTAPRPRPKRKAEPPARGPERDRRAKGLSSSFSRLGTNRPTPKRNNKASPTSRRRFCGSPRVLSTAEPRR